jgi:hypothetical protein
MRVFWERVGVLGPIYRLVGRGLGDSDIANKLNVDETRVQSCISWMLRFLRFTTRAELVLHACPASSGTWAISLPSKNIGA